MRARQWVYVLYYVVSYQEKKEQKSNELNVAILIVFINDIDRIWQIELNSNAFNH